MPASRRPKRLWPEPPNCKARDPVSDLTKSQAKAAKPKRRKMSWKKRIGLTFMVLIPLIIWYGFQPVFIVGSPLFGLCRTYIELIVPFPDRIQYVDLVDNFDGKVNVDYIYTDGFGEHLYTQATCTFKPDEESGNPVMTSFRYRRGGGDRVYRFNAEKQAAIDAFNKTIPMILADPPDLRVRAIPKEIKEYKQ